MQNIQEIFNRLQETKKEQKEIRAAYRDTLESSAEYQQTIEKLKVLKQKKKEIESYTRTELGAQGDRLDTLKQDIKMDREMLADIAISTLMKGETVKVVDADKNEYEPQFSVSFKKTNVVSPVQWAG